MLKYVPEMTSVVLEEIPDRLTLAVEVSNCRGNCPGCHSPFLREDVGEELTAEVIDRLVGDNFGVNCFLFLGEGRDPAALLALAAHVRSLGLAVALYSGREDLEDALWEAFDYVKVGPYRAECGPLNARTTNQRLYRALEEGEEAQRRQRSSFRARDYSRRAPFRRHHCPLLAAGYRSACGRRKPLTVRGK